MIQMHESTSVKIDRVIPQNLCFPEACHLDSVPSAGLGPVLAVISVEQKPQAFQHFDWSKSYILYKWSQGHVSIFCEHM